MTTLVDLEDDAFLAVARQALSSTDATAVLDSLGWGDLLRDLDDLETRRAAFALFRAHGRELANSPALGRLMSGGQVVAAIPRPSMRQGVVHVVLGDVTGCQILVGDSLIDPADVPLRRIDVPGLLDIHEVEVDAAAGEVGSVRLGRLALALEMLGAAEGALDLAVEHAKNREQFDQPIGRFQAVRHLLARAVNDIVAITAVTSAAVDLGSAAPDRFDAVVKALAGRNARRACEATLQVLGGIGFTAEHRHHHFHSRVLALDSLLGSSADLTHDLGRAFREDGVDPLVPALSLLTADR
jgi:hypothetical protein